jgi:hypothetical protein
LGGIIDCPRLDFSNEGGLFLRCEPVLVPTMLPGGSAADIRVMSSDHGVADTHQRDHLIVIFTYWKQSKHISLCSTGHIGWGYNCTEGVPYMVEGQLASYLRFSHVICMCRANFMVCKKTVPSKGSHLKVNINLTKGAKCLLFGTTKERMPSFVILISHGFTFVI